MQMMVRLFDAMSFSALITFCALNESSPVVGSSKNMSDGSVTEEETVAVLERLVDARIAVAREEYARG